VCAGFVSMSVSSCSRRSAVPFRAQARADWNAAALRRESSPKFRTSASLPTQQTGDHNQGNDIASETDSDIDPSPISKHHPLIRNSARQPDNNESKTASITLMSISTRAGVLPRIGETAYTVGDGTHAVVRVRRLNLNQCRAHHRPYGYDDVNEEPETANDWNRTWGTS
jgi:hypothetical protein